MVGQSVMCAMIIMSFLGSSPHSWGNVLGDGSPSLNYHLICRLVHQSCSIWMVDHQWWLAYISCPCFSRLFSWSCKMVLMMFCSCGCVMHMVWIYCNPWNCYFCALLVYLMEGFCLGNLLQHGYTHHNQNTLYGGNDVPCIPIPDTGSICPHHLTWYSLRMRAIRWLLTVVPLEVFLPPWWHLLNFVVPFLRLLFPKCVHF